MLLSVHSLAFPDPAGAPWSSVGGEAVLSRRWDSSVTSPARFLSEMGRSPSPRQWGGAGE